MYFIIVMNSFHLLGIFEGNVKQNYQASKSHKNRIHEGKKQVPKMNG